MPREERVIENFLRKKDVILGTERDKNVTRYFAWKDGQKVRKIKSEWEKKREFGRWCKRE